MVQLGSVTLATITPNNTFSRYSYTVTISAGGSVSLSFINLGQAGLDTTFFLDDVTTSIQGPSPTVCYFGPHGSVSSSSSSHVSACVA